MAVVLQGFLGPFTGKVGGAVGGIWKGINYIKGYVIPANPKTAAQQAQRGKFAQVVALAQSLLPTLIANFWNPFAVKMSGYNYFIQQFINTASSTGFALVTSIVTKGSLESALVLSGTYANTTGAIAITYDVDAIGNGLSTDDVGLLVIDKTTNAVLYYDPTAALRGDGSIAATVQELLLASNILIYLWCSRGTGSTFMVSDSVGYQASAAP